MKTTNYMHKRNRITTDCSNPKLTEQHHKNACDINNIVAQFQKTGLMPQSVKIPRYSDNTNVPDLVDAFYTVQEAQESFLELPANIRRLMDNDPSQMENFMLNPENTDILKKYGLVLERETKGPTEIPTSPLPKETKEKTE